jgi:L-rhamnose isomerase
MTFESYNSSISKEKIEESFQIAKKQYEALGIKVEDALEKLKAIPISLHCWQGDDVGGFETPDSELSGGGIQTTGNYPGKAKSIEQLRADFEKALSLIPGNHRINLHAIYGDFQGKKVERDQISIEHFQSWVDWAKKNNLGIDFNSTLFSHPKADSGFTLSNKDPEVRKFWIEHCKRCREISLEMGKQLNNKVMHNIWIPDGSKDIPIDRLGHRELLTQSLDEILAEKMDSKLMGDSVEGKLFGIGSESYVVGSNDYYLSYAISRKICLTLDMGHYHPTESVADKISSIYPFTKEILLHVSRGVRWDSDHVVILNEELKSLMNELVKLDKFPDIHIGLDFFDASINRIGAWVIGTRSSLKALLSSLLMPWDKLKQIEEGGKLYQRLALLQEMKSLPLGAIWNKYCLDQDVPQDIEWFSHVEKYEKEILMKR